MRHEQCDIVGHLYCRGGSLRLVQTIFVLKFTPLHQIQLIIEWALSARRAEIIKQQYKLVVIIYNWIKMYIVCRLQITLLKLMQDGYVEFEFGIYLFPICRVVSVVQCKFTYYVRLHIIYKRARKVCRCWIVNCLAALTASLTFCAKQQRLNVCQLNDFSTSNLQTLKAQPNASCFDLSSTLTLITWSSKQKYIPASFQFFYHSRDLQVSPRKCEIM